MYCITPLMNIIVELEMCPMPPLFHLNFTFLPCILSDLRDKTKFSAGWTRVNLNALTHLSWGIQTLLATSITNNQISLFFDKQAILLLSYFLKSTIQGVSAKKVLVFLYLYTFRPYKLSPLEFHIIILSLNW